MNLSMAWPEYEVISLKTKPTSYWEQSSFRQTGSPQTIVYNFPPQQVNDLSSKQKQTKGLSGGDLSVYTIVGSFRRSLRFG